MVVCNKIQRILHPKKLGNLPILYTKNKQAKNTTSIIQNSDDLNFFHWQDKNGFNLGEKINIDTLAAELNVSNSPIREALTMLEKQGLVEYVPNVGSRIISFSPTAFREICFSLFTVVYGAYELCLSQNIIDIAVEKPIC